MTLQASQISECRTDLVDLMILGAGPAGCAAAICARQAGMSVVLLDLQRAPKAIPGETLHPGVEPILKSLGVWDTVLQQKFHRHRGIWHEDKSGQRKFVPYGGDASEPWLGFQVDRVRLNGILQSRAKKLGADIVRVRRVDGVIAASGSAVLGVMAEDSEYAARFTLDATGRHGWLANRLGLVSDSVSPAQRVRFGWTRTSFSDHVSQPLFQEQRDGWNWTCPIGNGRSAWVKLRRNPGYRGMDYTWRIFRECAGPGYFLLGDAACLMDPSAANGVLRALMSGMYSVHLISATDCGLATTSQAAAEYRRWFSDLFDKTRTELAIPTEFLQQERFRHRPPDVVG